METAKSDLQHSLQKFKQDNFKVLGPTAFFIYICLAFVDQGLSERGLAFFLVLRLIFVFPTLFLSLLVDKVSPKKVDIVIFLGFLFAGAGVSVISYFLGGIQSDYYFGLIIVSFVQYAFAPLDRYYSIVLDIAFLLMFFALNTIPFEYPSEEIIKQVSNFVSFLILKFMVVLRSRNVVIDAIKKVRLERELEGQKNIQKVLGELCHLFNNPLFISMSLLKKLKKGNGLSESEKSSLSKIYESNERMNKVLQKMLKITDKSNGKIELKDLID